MGQVNKYTTIKWAIEIYYVLNLGYRISIFLTGKKTCFSLDVKFPKETFCQEKYAGNDYQT